MRGMSFLTPLLLLASIGATSQAEKPSDELRSYFTRPLYLGEEPPECRSVRRLLIRFDTVGPETRRAVGRTRDAALDLARRLVLRLDGGEPFEALVEAHSEGPERSFGGVLGTFPPGVLRPDIDAFLWSAELGAVSPVLEGPDGFEIVQRVESLAACRTILVHGHDEAARTRALSLLERARAGEDFAALAREHSDDPSTRASGGAHAIFERGPEDRLLKRDTFRAAVGECFGPLDAPTGLLVVRRVPVGELPPELFHSPWIRARCIFLAHRDVGGPRDLTDRTVEETRDLAFDLHERLRSGEDMAGLAARYGEDLDGRLRRGDLGWIHRENPYRLPVLDPLFLAEPGELLEPLPVEAGWLLLRRER